MKISKEQELLLGPPGTGKTTTVLNKVSEDMENGISSKDIAFVSFTRKAVGEAKDRAIGKFNLSKNDFPLFQTVHSLCFNGLGLTKNDMVGKDHFSELGEWLGYDFDCTFDETEVNIGNGLGDKLLFLENYSRITNTPLKKVWEANHTEVQWDELERFQEAYVEFKSSRHIFDFTDILFAYSEFCDPSRAEIVYVDEAQDLSWAQWKALTHAFKYSNKAIIAGDDDQSIYKWSGADTDTFLSLEGSRTVLDQSYRLPRAVHRFAKGIITKIHNRFDKPFSPRDEEGSVDFVPTLEYSEISSDESTLILVRNTYMMNKCVDFLHRQGLPYVGRSGYSSVRRAHLTAIVACESLRARRTITGKQLKELAEHLRVGVFLARGNKVKISLVSDKDEFTYDQVKEFGIGELTNWSECLEGIPYNTRQYYRTILANGYKLSAEPKIRLSTIHGIKGGEADHVVLYSDMANKSFEEYMKNPDNERRVAYVGVTRAKQKLSIIHPYTKRFFDYRGESYE